MTLIATLWHLQTIDQVNDDVIKRLQQIETALASDPTVAAGRAALDAEQKELTRLRANLRDRELEAKSLDAKIAELNERLYGGRVTNPKELDGYAKDAAMYQRNRNALDDKLLELMDAIDQAQKRVDEKANALKQVETKRAGDLANLQSERAALTARLAELAADRERTRAALAPDILRTYDKLRQTKAGRAVTQLKHNACGVCGMSVPTGLVSRVRAGEEIVTCPSCGRILAS